MSKPRLEWLESAISDLSEIVAYIARDNPWAACELQDEIEAKAKALPGHPKLYKPSLRIENMREMVIRNTYIVFYRESPERVQIVNVVHGRRQWPPEK